MLQHGICSKQKRFATRLELTPSCVSSLLAVALHTKTAAGPHRNLFEFVFWRLPGASCKRSSNLPHTISQLLGNFSSWGCFSSWLVRSRAFPCVVHAALGAAIQTHPLASCGSVCMCWLGLNVFVGAFAKERRARAWYYTLSASFGAAGFFELRGES